MFDTFHFRLRFIFDQVSRFSRRNSFRIENILQQVEWIQLEINQPIEDRLKKLSSSDDCWAKPCFQINTEFQRSHTLSSRNFHQRSENIESAFAQKSFSRGRSKCCWVTKIELNLFGRHFPRRWENIFSGSARQKTPIDCEIWMLIDSDYFVCLLSQKTKSQERRRRVR